MVRLRQAKGTQAWVNRNAPKLQSLGTTLAKPALTAGKGAASLLATLTLLGVPFPLLWALWVALVDFLPMIGGALAGIPTMTLAFAASASRLTAVLTGPHHRIGDWPRRSPIRRPSPPAWSAPGSKDLP